MPLEPGARLGPYEILSPLGAGGMGEVYSARDTRLDRTVAIKVLPSHLAGDAQLKQRFEREARAVSSLNHPHICTLHDIGHQSGVDYLVMEHIEGETLASRLGRGPLPLDEALTVARQIADALDKAHRQGVVHRDLKPGNIMLTKSGAKLLDFGLAKSAAGPAAGTDMTATPTMTKPLTAEGAIVGTFQYMAPEQLEGQEADVRTDVFAFGAMLYEMVTGRRAFEGKSQASLIGSIMKASPSPMSELVPVTPPSLERLVRVCLAKDPDDRRQTMRGVLLDLEWISEGGDSELAPAPVQAGAPPRMWMAAAAVLLLTTIVFAAMALKVPEQASAPTRLSLVNPLAGEGVSVMAAVISPDGRSLLLLGATKGGNESLWLRPMDSLEARPLPGTDGAYAPFWSPDSKYAAFFADGKLKKINVGGGPPEVICDAPSPQGGSWGRGGTILFAASQDAGLSAVPAAGGEVVEVTHLDPIEEGHIWPSFLPDGERFVFLADSSQTEGHNIKAAALGSAESSTILHAVSNPVFVAPADLLFVRAGTLLRQPLDASTLKVAGDSIPLAVNLLSNMGGHHFSFSASQSGALVYHAADQTAQLTWVDRKGEKLSTVGEQGQFANLDLSPGGQRLAYGKVDPDGRIGDLWMLDLSRGISSRLTFHSGAVNSPVWSSDEETLFFGFSPEPPNSRLYEMSVARPGTDSPIQLGIEGGVSPSDSSRDGRYLLLEGYSTPTKADLWVKDLAQPEQEVRPLIQSRFAEYDGAISADGRWLAYVSDESGRDEVYLQSFPPTSWRVQVTSEGGYLPRWRGDGRELFFLTYDGHLGAATLTETGDRLQTSPPVDLFEFSGYDYEVDPGGERFLLPLTAETPDTAPFTVVLDWMSK